MDLQYWLGRAVEAVDEWAAQFGSFAPHPVQEIGDQQFGEAFGVFTRRLRDNYPFFHPRYAGQMVKPPHPAAVVGYLTAMLLNPNNQARDGGPATTDMEREVVAQLGQMFGLSAVLGHLTTSGTVANLEALWVGREIHPGQGVAFSAESHFTHTRACRLLGVEAHAVPAGDDGRIDLDALESLLRRGRIGTVVLTAGTTGTGAVDAIDEALALRERYGVRLHVDAAYGGFFALLAESGAVRPEPWAAIRHCDSVVVDPHKHGLQPYGCGAVLFADPSVARHYLHDSPHTYLAPGDLPVGGVGLECSRAGAAAAALWLTLRLLPPTPEGLGQVLAVTRRTALRWADLIEASTHLRLHQRPDLDIVTYFPRASSLSAVERATRRVLRDGMHDLADPVYLSMMRVDAEVFGRRHPAIVRDAPQSQVLRSVLMKPEAETHLTALHDRIEELVAEKGRSVRVLESAPPDPVVPRVRPGTRADRGPLVALLAAALHSNPVMEWVIPDPRRREALVPAFFRSFYDRCLAGGGVYTTDELDAVLLAVGPDEPAGYDTFPARLAESVEERADALRALRALQDRQRPRTPHWQVAFAGVAPGCRRRGLDADLLASLLSRCDESGVPTYTEASSPSGQTDARRYGFVPVGEEIRLPGGPTLRPMWREPRVRAC
ncbi:pyridoxal phosphate-dependent decarboxylase family protein [Micromonospora sp. NPDC051925]|uniref:pyridoxal phosphate-dependent decarboxylase family protein n=1 Tax=Micromonospora sp. NPDC051925 TaxID=3364288 RepID=UPI0037CB8373